MQIQIRHLQRRGNVFFFRIRVPEDIQNHFGGKREIVKSLKTNNSNLAVIKAHEIAEIYKRQFCSYRCGETIEIESPHLPDRLFANVQKTSTALPIQQTEATSPLLSDVLKEMNAARSTKSKTIMSRSSAIRLLIDWFGDLPVTEYTRPMMISFRDDGMTNLPPNLYKGDTYKGKCIHALAEKNLPHTMTLRTVNNKLSYINSVFNYGVKHGYLNYNPAVELHLKLDKAPSKERDNYTAPQIQRMINSIAKLTASDDANRDQIFWVTLICLYQGARLNEIAQLSITDLSEIDEIPCLNITTEGETLKSLKNARSSRRIPIHPTLIDLGLLRYHNQRTHRCPYPERTNLWPNATCDKDGNYGRKVSRWFNEILRPNFLNDQELADHKARRKSYCFHSLRHTFIHFAQNQAQMNPRIEMRLTGHTDAFISEEHARYGKDMHPSIMLKELSKLDYNIDLSAITCRY